ncbi:MULTISPECIES: CBS domain-containing protein [unclassified Spirosoma]|uniref:CBS domain-containing protein n=1 Tax=unclassified Spirosoma TaxID=2621999 RepID=UPI000960D472|nr:MULTISPECIES: CBS domain-containing protein [unclassified Spirosoma]MBN8825210.1 CBS domain-containing protein [Spirosoma sp.]OJW75300.1 MAG: histidine kinase [Spirosoma sp. 48-14]
MKIRQILQGKSINALYSVSSDQTVLTALELMADKNIGAVLVVDKGELTGIFSERDYARKIVLKGRHSDDTKIVDVMTANVITIAPEQSLEECMRIMSDKHIRHLPVMDKGELVGIISINDVVTAIIRDQKTRIDSLESYISGTY